MLLRRPWRSFPLDQTAAETEVTPEMKVRQKWLDELEASDKFHADWFRRGDRILDQYEDKRPESSGQSSDMQTKRVNIFWANVELLKPALYGATPAPEISRRWRKRDPLGVAASTVIDRALRYQFDVTEFDQWMRRCVTDYLLPGRGTVWVTYYPKIQNEQLIDECAYAEHVNWRDFRTNAARTWDEVWWVGRRHYMGREELKEKFGEAVAKGVNLDTDQLKADDASGGGSTPEPLKSVEGRAEVWEIWDSRAGNVIWVSKSYKNNLLVDPAPPKLTFRNFFPCPRPLHANDSNRSVIPTPDFSMYQDQVALVNEVESRINVLTKAVKVAGAYNGKFSELSTIFDGRQNKLVSVSEWGEFMANNGMAGAVQLMPLDTIINALAGLYALADYVTGRLMEVSGVGDVLRGASDYRETATAQEIKSNYAGLRLRDRQREVQRFIRDVIRLMSEVICEQFSVETLAQVSQLDLPTPQQKLAVQRIQQILAMAQQMAGQAAQQGIQWQAPPEVIQAQQHAQTPEFKSALEDPSWQELYQFIRDDRQRTMLIDIESDSTIEPDDEIEKRMRVEFLTAVGGFMQNVQQLVAGEPRLLPLAAEMLMFGVRGFRVGTELESTIEETLEEIKNAPQQTQQDPAQNPLVLAEQVKAQAKQVELQAKQELEALKLQQQQEKGRVDQSIEAARVQQDQAELAQKAASDAAKLAEDARQADQSAAVDILKINADVEESELDRQARTVQAGMQALRSMRPDNG